ncbi:MAG: Hsp70 family protein [Pirellulales bacterium]|nr:Hsp70 family protein [Pirellulales bacterium]
MAVTLSVGIDLGTTFSAAAYVDAHGATQMIRNAHGEILTPSVAIFEQDEIIVGHEAWRAGEFSGGRVAETVKRDMGRTHYRHRIHGELIPPEVIQGCILRKLRSDIVNAIGPDFQVVITVPAYFDEPRRKATADAGLMSGLDILDIVNEPTAAALAFGERLGYLDPKGAPRDALTLLVYDLGGGTFDVTVIHLAPGDIRTLATDGDAELGGYNWDERLVEHVLSQFQDRYPQCPKPDNASQLRLRRLAEEAKQTLSARSQTTIVYNHSGHALVLPVTRDEFESMTADLVERTSFTTRQSLRAAGLLWNDINRLLLVGGSTRMPMIRSMLENLSGMTPDIHVNPDEAVARGAAIFARHLLDRQGTGGALPNLKITDVNAHSLGIEGINQKMRRKENVILIPRNTPLPKEIRRNFVTREFNQQSVQVQLLEGESKQPEHCTVLANAAIRHLPPGLKKGTKIEVWYRYESNGRLSVHARVPGIGKEAKIELERIQGLSDETVHQWKKIICRDGGFNEFEEALLELLEAGEDDEEDGDIPEDPPPSKREISLKPATAHGAPLAASEALKQKLSPLEGRTASSASAQASSDALQRQRIHADPPDNGATRTPQTVTGRRPLERTIFVIGYIVSSLLGLAIGYYILCWIRPEANFLHLDLPGIGP